MRKITISEKTYKQLLQINKDYEFEKIDSLIQLLIQTLVEPEAYLTIQWQFYSANIKEKKGVLLEKFILLYMTEIFEREQLHKILGDCQQKLIELNFEVG